jgi:hypothetical protein
MKSSNKPALKTAVLAAAAILAVTTTASGVNLLAYYPCDSPATAISTPRNAGSAIGGFAANATISTSGGVPYGNMFSPGHNGRAFLESSAAGGGAANANARLSFGSADPFAATGSFTYSLWFYTPPTFISGAQTFILSKFGTANSATQLDFKLMLRNNSAGTSAGDLQLMTWGGASVATVQTAATMPVANGWHHYAITAAKASPLATSVTWGLYVDGNPISIASPTANISVSANNIGMTIGKNIGNQASFGFEGVMADEIAFYDGVLNQSQVQYGMLYGPTMIPEPSALGVALVGGLMLLIRRRRQ